MSDTDRGVFHCTKCDYSTTDIFQIGCPECDGSLFLPIDENPNFHSLHETQEAERDV